jgi:hypothetical protein
LSQTIDDPLSILNDKSQRNSERNGGSSEQLDSVNEHGLVEVDDEFINVLPCSLVDPLVGEFLIYPFEFTPEFFELTTWAFNFKSLVELSTTVSAHKLF